MGQERIYSDFARKLNPQKQEQILKRWAELYNLAYPAIFYIREHLGSIDPRGPFYTCPKPIQIKENMWHTDFGDIEPIQLKSTALFLTTKDQIVFDSTGKCIGSPHEIIPYKPDIPPFKRNFSNTNVTYLSDTDISRRIADYAGTLIQKPELLLPEDNAFLFAIAVHEEISKELLKVMMIPDQAQKV